MTHTIPTGQRLEDLAQIIALLEPDDVHLFELTQLARQCDSALERGDKAALDRAADEIEQILKQTRNFSEQETVCGTSSRVTPAGGSGVVSSRPATKN